MGGGFRPMLRNFPCSQYDFLSIIIQPAATNAQRSGIFSVQKMALGGLNDQIGGGFHRYSVDKFWLVSHFEKMLYDQAQLS